MPPETNVMLRKLQSRLKHAKALYPYLIIIALTVLLLLPQISQHIYLTGSDSWFHMNQYYDAAMQFKTGHFSYFLSLFGFGGIGRIVNAIYGPGFMYFNGLLLLLAHTWFRFEIIQNFLVLVISGSLFYILAHKAKVTVLTSLLLSLMYMLSEPVFSFITSQDYNGVEAVLMPLIFIQAIDMAEKKSIRPFLLGVTMALIFQTHMLTVLSSTLTLIPFFVLAWCKTKRALTLWKNLGLSILLTIALTGNVWGAMLNILPQRLIPPVPQNFPSGSLYPQTFLHFSVIGPIYTLLLAFLIGCGLLGIIFWNRSDALYKITYLVGLFFLWMSSEYFPWPWIIKFYPAYDYQIQFPKRFLCVGIIALLISNGMILSYHHVRLINSTHSRLDRIILIMIQVILILFVGLNYKYQKSMLTTFANKYRSSEVIGYNPFYTYNTDLHHDNELRNSYGSSNLRSSLDLVHQDTADYLPTYKTIHTYNQYNNTKVHGYIQSQFYGRNLNDFRKKISGNRLTLSWNQPSRKKMALPAVKYKDTEVIFNHHIDHHAKISRVGSIYEKVPKGHNTLSIRYQAPIWMHVLMVTTAISWLSALLWTIYIIYLKLDQYI